MVTQDDINQDQAQVQAAQEALANDRAALDAASAKLAADQAALDTATQTSSVLDEIVQAAEKLADEIKAKFLALVDEIRNTPAQG